MSNCLVTFIGTAMTWQLSHGTSLKTHKQHTCWQKGTRIHWQTGLVYFSRQHKLQKSTVGAKLHLQLPQNIHTLLEPLNGICVVLTKRLQSHLVSVLL